MDAHVSAPAISHRKYFTDARIRPADLTAGDIVRQQSNSPWVRIRVVHIDDGKWNKGFDAPFADDFPPGTHFHQHIASYAGLGFVAIVHDIADPQTRRLLPRVFMARDTSLVSTQVPLCACTLAAANATRTARRPTANRVGRQDPARGAPEL